MKKLSIFILVIFFSSGVSSKYGYLFSTRRIKGCLVFPTEKIVEQSVAECGGWEDFHPNVKRATVDHIGELALTKPLTIAKKITDRGVLFKHLICDILEDFWLAEGRYKHPHIPSVLGQYEKGYYYIWVPGSESLELTYQNVTTRFEEETTVEYLFSQAGFSIFSDIEDDTFSFHNFIISPKYNWYREVMDKVGVDSAPDVVWVPAQYWTRIDFDNSLSSNPNETAKYIKENEKELKKVLGDWKFELLTLAYKCWVNPSEYQKCHSRFVELFPRYLEEKLKNEGYISK